MKSRFAGLLAMTTALAWSPALAQPADTGQTHTINLTDVDLSVLIEDVAMLTGYAFVSSPDVRGSVTINSPSPLTNEEVFQVFLATLRVHGFTAVPSGRGVYRIVPEAVAVGEADSWVRSGDGFVTQVFRLDHFSAVEAAKMINPLLSAQGQVTASPASNALFVVEFGSNIARIKKLIEEIDIDNSVTRTVALKTVPVSEMQDILNNLGFGGTDERARSSFSATGSQSSNAVILRGDPAYVERAMTVINELDSAPSRLKDVRVITLSHSNASEIEPILSHIVSDQVAGAGATQGAVETRISVHAPSNSLIISASPETLSNIERVIADLDKRPKQVQVEAIIVEMSDVAARELGLQFLVAGQDGDIPFVSSTFSADPGNSAPNLLALTGALAGLGDDAGGGGGALESAALASLLGLTGGTVGFGGQRGDTIFSVILNAVEDDTESNILSTPSILTLDNQEAFVSVGQEIPITSGEVLGDANANPFRTVERREIGIILTITPRIGADDTVRLDIKQEVSSIAAAVGGVTQDFILNLSEIETSIVADDGEMRVIGGLVQAEDAEELTQVPLLGDIPGLGRLFQNEAKSRETTNLMIFIRPTIVRDSDEANAITSRSYNFIRAQQIIANDGGPASIDRFVAEVFDGVDPLAPPATEEDGS